MKHWLVSLTALAMALMALTPQGAATAGPPAVSPDAGCVRGDATAAAAATYGPGSTVQRRDVVKGLHTVLVLEPGIHPGIRHRMVGVGDQWCDATTALNAAWQATGREVGDGRALAEAYASLAAAPYFDQVTVREVTGAAGAWVVSTHARTNGVVARWTILTDASGILEARWVATDFARAPFVASWEGLTALPEATEQYTRGAGGVLAEVRGVPTGQDLQAEDGEPGLSTHTFKDGFTITVSVGDSHIGIDPGTDTGVDRADIVRATLRAAKINYHDFRDWGLTKGWEAPAPLDSDTGYIYINDALSAYCLACVLTADNFNIHMNSEAQTALTALGYDGYRDARLAYQLIIGHEMFHNFQNRYTKPGVIPDNLTSERFTLDSYSEGTARFQETLHDYSPVTFAPNTLLTAQDANGCNGYDESEENGGMDAGMASGPFNKTYNACYFWGPWFVAQGKKAFLDLVREGMPATATEDDGFSEIGRAIGRVTERPVAQQLAEFAASAITGHGRSWATWDGRKKTNWGSLFDTWKPSRIGVGKASTRFLGGGGAMAHRITKAARVSLKAGPDEQLFLIVDKGRKVTVDAVRSNSVVVRPASGQKTYAVAIRPAGGSGSATLKVTGPNSPAPAGNEAPTGPAQSPVSGTVTTAAPGAGERVEGVTSQYVEFEVPGTVDNARSEVKATNLLPADIDLYLQAFDGTSWVDIAEGASADVLGEALESGRLGEGRYRVEVHNWAGPAGNQIDVQVTFFNSGGEAGT